MVGDLDRLAGIGREQVDELLEAAGGKRADRRADVARRDADDRAERGLLDLDARRRRREGCPRER